MAALSAGSSMRRERSSPGVPAGSGSVVTTLIQLLHASGETDDGPMLGTASRAPVDFRQPETVHALRFRNLVRSLKSVVDNPRSICASATSGCCRQTFAPFDAECAARPPASKRPGSQSFRNPDELFSATLDLPQAGEREVHGVDALTAVSEAREQLAAAGCRGGRIAVARAAAAGRDAAHPQAAPQR